MIRARALLGHAAGAPVDEVARLGRRSAGSRRSSGAATCTCRPGDTAAARAPRASAAAGSTIASYGSYLFAAGPPDEAESGAVLDTAVALGVPNVRVWAGVRRSSPAPKSTRGSWTGSRRSRSRPPSRELTVGLEFHGGTPTATRRGRARAARRGRRTEPLDLLAAAVLARPDDARRPTPRRSTASAPAFAPPRVRVGRARGPAPARRRAPTAGGVLGAACAGGDRVAFLEFVDGRRSRRAPAVMPARSTICWPCRDRAGRRPARNPRDAAGRVPNAARVHEEDVWVGVRWRIRTRTFAYLLTIADGRPPATLWAWAPPGRRWC